MKLRLLQHLALATAISFCAPAVYLRAQDPIQPPEGVTQDSEWLYGKHLEQVQEIMKISDLNQRAQKLEAFFLKLDPKTKIRPYMESFFAQTVEDMKKAGKTQDAEALSAKMAKFFPNSSAQTSQQFNQALQSKNWPKVIELGEKFYASTPSKQLTVTLAQAYIATNNGPKAAEYSAKAVQALGPKDGIYYVAWLADYYVRQKDGAKAKQYYAQALEAYPTGTPSGWDAKAWNNLKATAYALRAEDAYSQKNWDAAIQAYTESLKLYPQNDTAYLFLGMCYWNQQKLDEATNAFAKAVVLNKGTAAKARELLEKIYKPRHDDSLKGLDDVLAKAKADLGI